jgi:hypothetical protein
MKQVFLSLLVLALLGAMAFAAPPDTTPIPTTPVEATLYTQNMAEVTATAVCSGPGTVVLSLPKSIEPDSVSIEEQGKSLPSTIKPVMKTEKIIEGRELSQVNYYLAELTGLSVGKHPLTLHYRVQGLGWKPNYSLQISQSDEGVLTSAITISNDALSLENATLKLVSGRVQTQDYYRGGYYPEYMMGSNLEELYRLLGPNFRRPALGNIHQIEVLRNVTLTDPATRQLPVQEIKQGVEKLLVWNATERRYDYPPSSSQASAVYTLHNQTGRPLAEGIVKVYEKGTFVGEGFLGWTPEGDTGILILTGVKDLTVKKTEKTEPVPDTWEMRSITTLAVTNNGNLPAQVKVLDQASDEDTYRSSSNKKPIYEFSETPEVTSEKAYVWNFELPAKASHTITYQYLEAVDTSKYLALRFIGNDSDDERRYIYENQGSYSAASSNRRFVKGASNYIIYRLDLPDDLRQADLVVKIGGDFVISLAQDQGGKPGEFRPMALASVYAAPAIADYANYTYYYLDLAPYLGKHPSNVLYVKFSNGPSGGAKWPTRFYSVEVVRIPPGFSSRGRDYSKPSGGQAAPDLGKPLFSEDFSKGNLSEWQTERGEAVGKWQIKESLLTPLGQISDRGSLLTKHSFPKDLTAVVDWQALDLNSFELCLVFSAQEQTDAYYDIDLWLDADNRLSAAWYWEGQGKTLATAPNPIKDSLPHQLTLAIKGDVITVKLDGADLMKLTDPLGKLRPGPIGFRGRNFGVKSFAVYGEEK